VAWDTFRFFVIFFVEYGVWKGDEHGAAFSSLMEADDDGLSSFQKGPRDDDRQGTSDDERRS
jgi:hypothetical protein